MNYRTLNLCVIIVLFVVCMTAIFYSIAMNGYTYGKIEIEQEAIKRGFMVELIENHQVKRVWIDEYEKKVIEILGNENKSHK